MKALLYIAPRISLLQRLFVVTCGTEAKSPMTAAYFIWSPIPLLSSGRYRPTALMDLEALRIVGHY
jgi:hypothetical protein